MASFTWFVWNNLATAFCFYVSANKPDSDPEAMEILFVPEVPTQDELNRTWPGTQEKMHLRVYGHSTHADVIRYTDPEAMVAAPRLARLY